MGNLKDFDFLASGTVWISRLQWKSDNGPRNPEDLYAPIVHPKR